MISYLISHFSSHSLNRLKEAIIFISSQLYYSFILSTIQTIEKEKFEIDEIENCEIEELQSITISQFYQKQEEEQSKDEYEKEENQQTNISSSSFQRSSFKKKNLSNNFVKFSSLILPSSLMIFLQSQFQLQEQEEDQERKMTNEQNQKERERRIDQEIFLSFFQNQKSKEENEILTTDEMNNPLIQLYQTSFFPTSSISSSSLSLNSLSNQKRKDINLNFFDFIKILKISSHLSFIISKLRNSSSSNNQKTTILQLTKCHFILISLLTISLYQIINFHFKNFELLKIKNYFFEGMISLFLENFNESISSFQSCIKSINSSSSLRNVSMSNDNKEEEEENEKLSFLFKSFANIGSIQFSFSNYKNAISSFLSALKYTKSSSNHLYQQNEEENYHQISIYHLLTSSSKNLKFENFLKLQTNEIKILQNICLSYKSLFLTTKSQFSSSSMLLNDDLMKEENEENENLLFQEMIYFLNQISNILKLKIISLLNTKNNSSSLSEQEKIQNIQFIMSFLLFIISNISFLFVKFSNQNQQKEEEENGIVDDLFSLCSLTKESIDNFYYVILSSSSSSQNQSSFFWNFEISNFLIKCSKFFHNHISSSSSLSPKTNLTSQNSILITPQDLFENYLIKSMKSLNDFLKEDLSDFEQFQSSFCSQNSSSNSLSCCYFITKKQFIKSLQKSSLDQEREEEEENSLYSSKIFQDLFYNKILSFLLNIFFNCLQLSRISDFESSTKEEDNEDQDENQNSNHQKTRLKMLFSKFHFILSNLLSKEIFSSFFNFHSSLLLLPLTNNQKQQMIQILDETIVDEINHQEEEIKRDLMDNEKSFIEIVDYMINHLS